MVCGTVERKRRNFNKQLDHHQKTCKEVHHRICKVFTLLIDFQGNEFVSSLFLNFEAEK